MDGGVRGAPQQATGQDFTPAHPARYGSHSACNRRGATRQGGQGAGGTSRGGRPTRGGGGAQCYSYGQLGHWACQCPQAAVTGTLHQPHVQAKISQVGDQTILTSNKGWMFDLKGPPLVNCRRCGQPHWEMSPCGAQGRVSLLPASTADTQAGEPQAGEPMGPAGTDGTNDAMLRMIQGMLQTKAMNPDHQQ